MSHQSLLWVGQLHGFSSTAVNIIQANFHFAVFQEYTNKHFFLEVGGSSIAALEFSVVITTVYLSKYNLTFCSVYYVTTNCKALSEKPERAHVFCSLAANCLAFIQ